MKLNAICMKWVQNEQVYKNDEHKNHLKQIKVNVMQTARYKQSIRLLRHANVITL